MTTPPPTNLSDLLPQRIELPEPPPAGTQGDGETAHLAADQFPAKPAVYVLLDHARHPILLSSTANLRMGLLRRCAPPAAQDSPSRRTDYRQISRWVDYRRVSSAFAANLWYLRTARLLYPDRYHKMLAWKSAWFVAVNLSDEFPQFLPVPATRDAAGPWMGPFPDSTSARLAVHVLEDAFDLCRYYDILRRAPHGKPCAYKQMGKCPAPCDGSIGMADYRHSIRMAAEFLAGRETSSDAAVIPAREIRESWRQAQELQMRSAVAKLDFLAAARIKARINAAGRLSGERFSRVQPLHLIKFLIVQPGQSQSWIEPFFFQAGRIVAGQPVQKKHLSDALPQWCRQFHTPMPSGDGTTDDPGEMISLLCYHLFRSRDAGLYIAVDQSLPVESLAARIQAWLAQKQRPSVTMEQSSDAAPEPVSGPDSRHTGATPVTDE